MSFDITLHDEEHAHQTRVVVTGRATLGQLTSLLHVLEVDSATWRHDEVVLDLSGLKSVFSPAEQELLGQVARTRLPRKQVQLRWKA
jgi:hypothetical protein